MKLNADNLLRDYGQLKYLTEKRTFYFEKHSNPDKINLVYYVDGEKQQPKSYRKKYINGLTCSEFQRDALNLLNSVNPNANISIECVTKNTVIGDKIMDGFVLVFKNKKSAKKNAKKNKKSSKKNKKSAKKSMKRK